MRESGSPLLSTPRVDAVEDQPTTPTNLEPAVSPETRRYVAEGIDTVPGWFARRDAKLFVLAHEAQRACGVHGDVLEIGAFMGRSSILLGYICDVPGQRLVVSDIFDADETTEESKGWRPRGVRKPRRDEFTAQYLRFHRDPPEIISGPSLELDPEALGLHAFRLIHVDGAHDWTNVDGDLRLAEALASDDAVVVFDDVCNGAYPAVGARVWSEVVSGRLDPVAVTDKLYATTNPKSPVAEALRSRIQDAADLSASVHTIAGSDVLVVSDLDPGARPPSRTRPPSWKRVARDLSPPLLYRGASHLSSRIRRPAHDARRRHP
jgi:hypothetical protein